LGSKAKKRAPYISTGKGAAGLLVTASPEDDAVVPLVWIASSGTLVTALDKDDVERLGLLKLDFLGLKTYTALAEMIESTGVDLGTINFSNSAVYRMLSKGETTGVFQLEGKASMYGTKRLRPTKFGDLIAAMALFRPATMDSGATEDYIARKHKKQDVPQRHPILMDGTKDTYGVLLYQEQALDIFRNLGMTIEEIEKARKAIKASNENIGNAKKTLAELLIRVEALAREAGMNDEDYAWLQRALEAFAGYSFNRAHATGYAANAYITAWFKIYHPLEFWCAMLNAFDATEDQTKFTKAARAAKVKILPPHVNVPSLGYVVDYEATAIRRGLVSITGVGEKAAQAIIDNSPYVSVVDLATRANHRAVSGRNAILQGHTTTAAGGTIGALADDGALDDLPLGEVEKRVTKRRKAAGSPDQIALLDEDARREGDV
jgi:DNA polymerase-3 subunit alpha